MLQEVEVKTLDDATLARLAIQFAAVEEAIASFASYEHIINVVGDVFNTLVLREMERGSPNEILMMKINLVSIAIGNDFKVAGMLESAAGLRKTLDKEIIRRTDDAPSQAD